VFKNHSTAAKVTAELSVYLEDPVCSKKVRTEFHQPHIHSIAAIANPPTTENKVKKTKKIV
jgi:hypothetical protein